MAGILITDTVRSSLSTPPTFQNTSGTEIGQLCRAWVNFNGSNASIRSSFNVSSVTRSSTGAYTVNFTSAFADVNYSVAGSVTASYGGSSMGTTGFATTYLQISSSYGSGAFDASVVCVACFR